MIVVPFDSNLVKKSGTGTTTSYKIVFDDYNGLVEPLVPDTTELVAESGAVVSSEVVTVEEGMEPLRGDFTLSFRGQHTPALSYNSTADEVSAAGYGIFNRLGGKTNRAYTSHGFDFLFIVYGFLFLYKDFPRFCVCWQVLLERPHEHGHGQFMAKP